MIKVLTTNIYNFHDADLHEFPKSISPDDDEEDDDWEDDWDDDDDDDD